MTSLILSALVGLQSAEPIRTLERLPNGALIYVERMEKSDRVSAQLWISARGTEERLDTNGHRHLLEHFMARSQDRFTEENGLFLTAETTREAMSFRVEAPPEKLALALKALQNLFAPVNPSKLEIEREAEIIRHESALIPAARYFSRAAWAKEFGGRRPDPMGDPAVMKAVTPENLETLRQRMMASTNIVVTVCGSITPSVALGTLAPFLRTLPPAPPAMSRPDAPTQEPNLSVGARGAALAMRVEGVSDRETLAGLAVAFAADQALDPIELMYTPSSLSGLIILMSSDRAQLEAVKTLNERQLLSGITMLRRWAAAMQERPERVAAFRGALLAEGSTFNLENLNTLAAALTYPDVRDAWATWKSLPPLEGL